MEAPIGRSDPHNGRRSDFERRYDVIVVGAGPTGLAAANILAQAGHRVAIFERFPTPYNLPRAGHMDNEVLRILQGIDCLAAVMEDSFPIRRVPLLDADGEFLLELVPDYQSASSFRSVMMYQPVLEDALYGQLSRHNGYATVYQGWTVDGVVNQDDTTVHIRARPTDRTSDGSNTSESGWAEFDCSYLIAADGAASSIRQRAGIERQDFGVNERWLAIDMAYRRPCDFGPPAMVGDPRRPHFFSPLGKRHHRFDCLLAPDESTAEFSTPEKAWALLAERDVDSDDVEIVRQTVYTFEYRLAQRWREGRLFLMGDAAHTISPLLGQGMSSGIRDAANLGWKLDLVLRGVADASILESYETERRPHVIAWADLSVKAGEFICLTDPEKAAARNARIRSGEAPAWRPPPMLTAGLFDISPTHPPGLAGELFPQRTVRRNGRVGLFDDIAGREFLLLTRGDARPFLSRIDDTFMERIGMRWARISRDADDASALVDEAGEYESFFEKDGLEAIIVRPDRYVFGGVRNLDGLGHLVGKLKNMLERTRP
jgi:3-(3-hydroxy-phenyl)propionate hydroxylase